MRFRFLPSNHLLIIDLVLEHLFDALGGIFPVFDGWDGDIKYGWNQVEWVRWRVSPYLIIYLCAATLLCFSELFSDLNHTIKVV